MHAPPSLSVAQVLTWGRRPPDHALLPIADQLSTLDYHFQLIPIPGHAPDMLALYEPEREWLFSADLYINSYIGYFLPSERMATQIQSIKRILELNFKVMFCSHNPQLEHPKEKLADKLAFLESFFEQVANLHAKGYPVRQIMRRLKLRENWLVYLLSQAKLSKRNMVKSVIRDLTVTTSLDT